LFLENFVTPSTHTKSLEQKIRALAPGKVIDVSNMNPNGTKTTIIYPRTGAHGSPNIPIVSNNFGQYVLAMSLLPGGIEQHINDIEYVRQVFGYSPEEAFMEAMRTYGIRTKSPYTAEEIVPSPRSMRYTGPLPAIQQTTQIIPQPTQVIPRPTQLIPQLIPQPTVPRGVTIPFPQRSPTASQHYLTATIPQPTIISQQTTVPRGITIPVPQRSPTAPQHYLTATISQPTIPRGVTIPVPQRSPTAPQHYLTATIPQPTIPQPTRYFAPQMTRLLSPRLPLFPTTT